MTTLIWILLAVGFGYGALHVLRLREKREGERKARAEKRAKAARDDAQALRRTLNGRR